MTGPHPEVAFDVVAQNLAEKVLAEVRGSLVATAAAAEAAGARGSRGVSGFQSVLVRLGVSSHDARRGLTLFEGGVRSLAFTAAGVPGPMGKVAQSVLTLAGGGPAVVTGVIGLGALAFALNKMGESAREAADHWKRLHDTVDKGLGRQEQATLSPVVAATGIQTIVAKRLEAEQDRQRAVVTRSFGGDWENVPAGIRQDFDARLMELKAELDRSTQAVTDLLAAEGKEAADALVEGWVKTWRGRAATLKDFRPGLVAEAGRTPANLAQRIFWAGDQGPRTALQFGGSNAARFARLAEQNRMEQFVAVQKAREKEGKAALDATSSMQLLASSILLVSSVANRGSSQVAQFFQGAGGLVASIPDPRARTAGAGLGLLGAFIGLVNPSKPVPTRDDAVLRELQDARRQRPERVSINLINPSGSVEQFEVDAAAADRLDGNWRLPRPRVR